MQGHSDAECRLQQVMKPTVVETIAEKSKGKEPTAMVSTEKWIEVSRNKKKSASKEQKKAANESDHIQGLKESRGFQVLEHENIFMEVNDNQEQELYQK